METVAVLNRAANDDGIGVRACHPHIMLAAAAFLSERGDNPPHFILVPEESFRLGAFNQSRFFGDDVSDFCGFGARPN